MDKKVLKFLLKDKVLKEAYLDGKDLYSMLASILFDCKYEDCLEIVNGKVNPIGIKRRKIAKFLFASFYFNDSMYAKGLLGETVCCQN